jgi:hypothetical protein
MTIEVMMVIFWSDWDLYIEAVLCPTSIAEIRKLVGHRSVFSNISGRSRSY